MGAINQKECRLEVQFNVKNIWLYLSFANNKINFLSFKAMKPQKIESINL